MGLPQIVIVGRPNTGKSSVFNWLVGKRLAIVDPTAGVTRDRMSYLLCHEDRYFELVDTGGMGINDVDNLADEIEEQIQLAIDSADVVLFVVDAQAGMTSHDIEVAQRLRYLKQPIICVANKADRQSVDAEAAEFYKLGRGKLVCTSTTQNRGQMELLDMIVERLPEAVDLENEPAEAEEPEMKVALVGRRNTGKSTFINSLLKTERMIVSEIPGTTRDSVDVRFEMDGKAFIAIDTPGLTRSKAVKTDLDFYSFHRAQRSIRRADVVLIFFDPTQHISKVDRQLCDYVTDQYKPVFFVVNKWDLMVKTMPTEKWVTYLHDTFRTMNYAPIGFITGQTGKNMKALLNHSQSIFKQSRERVTTGKLNRLITAALKNSPPPVHRGRPAKVYYATQVGTQPPTIVLFCNNPSAFSQPYRRYLLKVFRDNLPFDEVPIKLYLRRREPSDTRDEVETPIADAATETNTESDVATN